MRHIKTESTFAESHTFMKLHSNQINLPLSHNHIQTVKRKNYKNSVIQPRQQKSLQSYFSLAVTFLIHDLSLFCTDDFYYSSLLLLQILSKQPVNILELPEVVI